uniref:ABC transmembrane type-1 domain-containing protein n=1 Tax=Panagrolaimus superbus TaxID=310955 RepID=A0A914Y8S3_9BILA
MNRLSGDIQQIDGLVPINLRSITKLSSDCVFYTVSAIYVMPQLGILTVPTIFICIVIVRFYTLTSVQIRRLSSKSWSAVTSLAQESYVGASTLRIFNVQNTFNLKMTENAIITTEAKTAENVTSRWIQLSMDSLTAVFSSIFVIAAIYLGHTGVLDSGSVALVVTMGTLLRGLLAEIARYVNNVETCIVAVERVQEYVDNEHEAEWTSILPQPLSWPSEGNIEFKDFSLRYCASTPLVLKRLNLKIEGGQKIGIVGRTGAGKTSLTMALFRMIEPAEGTIIIDGIDFRELGLHQLRKSLTIIPQDPVLFCGKLRINLDPFEEFSDAEIWDAIEKAHLRKF